MSLILVVLSLGFETGNRKQEIVDCRNETIIYRINYVYCFRKNVGCLLPTVTELKVLMKQNIHNFSDQIYWYIIHGVVKLNLKVKDPY